MNIFLTQHFRKKKELYTSDEDVKIIIRVFDYNKKRFNITTGISVSFGSWIQNWKETHKKNPVHEKEPDSSYKNLSLKSELRRVEDVVFDIEREGNLPTKDLILTKLRSFNKKRLKNQLSEVHFLILLEKFKYAFENSR